ncbi:ferredoxin FdxA [Ramlibacter sp.]|uniref:ferredoxin FdxA n=1 Tax=Ramlibacter sp. TaxID=1917967 RepID=UPI0017E7E4D1|nr:ferredoxin FdxA [Ramlibacter sp.]MBA2676713.1 ferredoxin family protein [Ramlibacter sp.]
MTFVVTEQCIQCKFMDCVEVCPVDCFHEGPNFLAIDPDVCIDCNVCVPECPVDAIYQDKELPADQKDFLQINARLAAAWPQVVAKSAPLPDSNAWRDKPGKRAFLQTLQTTP